MLALQQLTSRQAFGLVQSQLAVTVLLSIILLVLFDDTGYTTAYSGLAGGLIATLANGWFALKVFNLKQKNDPLLMLRSFYWGEINKLVLTGALFVAAFVLLKPVNGAALIGVYFVVHMTPFVASIFYKNTH